MNYAALQVKTCYSILNSLNHIPKLVSLAAEYGYTSLAITDTNNMFGVMEFYNTCKKFNIKPIIGLELESYNILLYAKNNEGYKNLIKLSTIASTNELTINDLKTYCDNLILIMPFSFYNEGIYNIYEDKYIGYSKESEKGQIQKPKVYINDILYLYKDDYKYLDYAKMINEGKVLGEYSLNEEKGHHLLSPSELDEILTEEDIKNIEKIISSCNVEIKYNNDLLPVYNKEISAKDYLSKLSNKGLAKRLNNNVTIEYQKRLNHELEVIDKMGFNDYFLIVYDYVLYAKKNDILVGPGRGSAAGSLVSYTLGITDVDPIKYGLLFERFLNSERVTMPDIDIDFDAAKKEEVIDYVINKYGNKLVAGIITFNTLGAKQVIRDVGRILKTPVNKINSLAKMIKKDMTLKETYQSVDAFKKIITSQEELKKLYDISIHLEELPRHVSVNAAGIVMSKKDLDETVPLYKNLTGMYVTQYNKNYLEPLGLLKMDFLSLNNLTIIDEIINNIRKEENINISFTNIPLDDKETLKLFKEGLTDNIFQFESNGMKSLLKRLNPENFSDIVIALALYRPGPMDEIDEFLKRKAGKVEIDYYNDSLIDILKETYGTFVYQEQIMETARIIAGYSLGEADILRRAMAKKQEDVLIKEKEKFINGSINNGYTSAVAENIYNIILKFANYGLNKSHAVSYAMISYKMAFLKNHFYKYFTLAFLNQNINNEEIISKYIAQLRQKNIKVITPNINISKNTFEIINGEIICPLNIIKNIDPIVIKNIFIEREKEPFKSFIDFARRLSKILKEKDLKNLIMAGVFSSFKENKKTLVNNLSNILNYISLCSDDYILEEPLLDEFEEYTKEELLEQEQTIFGFYLTNHPVIKYRNNPLNTIYLEKYNSKFIELILEIKSIKEVVTKKNDVMAFVTAEDEFNTVSLTLFPNEYKKYNNIKNYDIIKIYGKVENRFDKYQIVVSNLSILNK